MRRLAHITAALGRFIFIKRSERSFFSNRKEYYFLFLRRTKYSVSLKKKKNSRFTETLGSLSERNPDGVGSQGDANDIGEKFTVSSSFSIENQNYISSAAHTIWQRRRENAVTFNDHL